MSAAAFREFLKQRDDLDALRVHYCYQIGSTFTSLALMEDTIINAMLMCNQIQVSSVLGPDLQKWEKFLEKQKYLQDSTLGNLISLLSRHGINADDLRYLRWLKNKRDFFVHRLFHKGRWPGELTTDDAEPLRRRLLYLEKIFVRAQNRIWDVFARAGLLHRIDLNEGGSLILNPDLFPSADDYSQDDDGRVPSG